MPGCHVASARLRLVLDGVWIGRRAGIRSQGHTLRFYIRPHFVKWPPVGRRLPWCRPPLRALTGPQNRPYAKCSWLERARRSSALPRPLRVLRAVTRHPLGVLAPGFQSGASRRVSGQWPAAMHLVCAPPTPRASPATRALAPRGLARPPPRGSLQNRAVEQGGGRASIRAAALLPERRSQKSAYIRRYIVKRQSGKEQSLLPIG